MLFLYHILATSDSNFISENFKLCCFSSSGTEWMMCIEEIIECIFIEKCIEM